MAKGQVAIGNAETPKLGNSRIGRTQDRQHLINVFSRSVQQRSVRRNQDVNRGHKDSPSGADDCFMVAKRVPGKSQPGRSIETSAQRRRLAIDVKPNSRVLGQTRVQLPSVLNATAKIIAPSSPARPVQPATHSTATPNTNCLASS